MGWNALPSLVVITGIWAIGLWGLDKVSLSREDNKPAWAINKDLFQKALYRRDWYLKREEETFSKWLCQTRLQTLLASLRAWSCTSLLSFKPSTLANSALRLTTGFAGMAKQ